jgi:urease accessory protein
LRCLIGWSSLQAAGADPPSPRILDEESRMNLMSRRTMRGAAAAAMAMGAGLAQAHPGHGASLLEGLAHPLALDHLLTAAAVGFWSVAALPRNKSWWGPAVFLLALIAGALLAAAGFGVPFLEQGLALGVVLFGAMLVLARRPSAGLAGSGLGIVAAAGTLHGLAHGAEAPTAGFAGYAAGFLVTTAALHLAGTVMGLSLGRHPGRARTVLAAVGGLVGGAGLYLFSLA